MPPKLSTNTRRWWARTAVPRRSIHYTGSCWWHGSHRRHRHKRLSTNGSAVITHSGGNHERLVIHAATLSHWVHRLSGVVECVKATARQCTANEVWTPRTSTPRG